MGQASNKNDITKKAIALAGLVVLVGVGIFLVQNKDDFFNTKDVIVAEIDGTPVYKSEASERLVLLSKGKKGVSFDALDDKGKMIIIREIAA